MIELNSDTLRTGLVDLCLF